jgi:hypothetical protein
MILYDNDNDLRLCSTRNSKSGAATAHTLQLWISRLSFLLSESIPAAQQEGVFYVLCCVTNSRTWCVYGVCVSAVYAILMKWDETTDNHRNYVLAALSEFIRKLSYYILIYSTRIYIFLTAARGCARSNLWPYDDSFYIYWELIELCVCALSLLLQWLDCLFCFAQHHDS